jgi:two-component system, NarL family, response regulator DesR
MIRIIIAEDQEMLLGAIGSLLDLEDDMEVVGQTRNGEEIFTLVQRIQPDVCIMDIKMFEKIGLEAAEALKTFECKIIFLTTFSRTDYYHHALKADVSGYLFKDSPSEELVCSIRRIMNGQRIFSPELMDDDSSDKERMMEVTELLDNGETSKQQKNKTGIVRNYFSVILDKMKLPTG